MAAVFRRGLALVLLLALLGGCGGTSSPGFELVPAPEGTPERVAESDGWRYVREADRLEFQTPEPTVTPTPWPTREAVRLSGRNGVEASDEVVRGRGVIPLRRQAEEVSLDGSGCVEYYRWLLRGYWDRGPFGPETALRLSEQLEDERADCLEEGWSPEFSLRAVCEAGTVAGTEVSSLLVRREGSMRTRKALSSGKDGYGNILVQFEKLPLREGRGCWYYSAFSEAWSWVVLGEASGIDLPVFPACEARLKEKLLAGDVEALRVADVAAAIDSVKLELVAECGGVNWNIYPGSGGWAECSPVAGTGYQDGGLLVLNWQIGHLASDGAVCWVHDVGSGEWKSFHSKVY